MEGKVNFLKNCFRDGFGKADFCKNWNDFTARDSPN